MKTRLRLLSGMAVMGMLAIACSNSTQAAPARGADILVGAPVSLSGQTSAEGGLAKQGYDLWAKWVNDGGGIRVGNVAHRVQVKYLDDQSRPAAAAEAAQRLIDEYHVQFLLGPYGSSNSAAVAPVAERNRVLLLDSNGAATDIFSHGYRYVFGVLSPADRYLQVVLDMAATWNRPKLVTIALLSADDNFSLDVANSVMSYAPLKGMQVVFSERYPSGSTNLYPALEKVRALNPDIVLNSGHLVEAEALNNAARDLRLGAKMYAYSVGPATPEFVQKLGPEADYVFTGAQWTPDAKYEVTWRLSVAQFVDAYKSMFPSSGAPAYQVAESTAAGLALQKAIESAGTTAGDRVRDALAGLDMFSFYGRIKFDERGANTFKPMLVQQIQSGEQRTVWPPEMASTRAQYPAPTWTERLGPVAAVIPPQMPSTGHPAD